MSMNFSAQQYSDVYEQLGIDTTELGCIMLDTDKLVVSDLIPEEDLYYAQDKEKHQYVNGIVSETVPHVTVLYGLMDSGEKWKEQVDEVLDGWMPKSVTISNVTAFESIYDDEAYYCLVAELELTPELLEGNARLRMLPHIDTFPTYRAHISLAYIKHDESVRDELLYALNNKFTGNQVKVSSINYGD